MKFHQLRFWDGISDELADADITIEIHEDRFLLSESATHSAVDRDFAGCFAIPGLIDAHVHLCLDPEVRDPLAHGKVPRDEQLAAMTTRVGQMLQAGITTARDLGGGKWLELEIRDRIAAGEIPGPRLLCAGQPVTSPGGHCHFWGGEAESAEEIQQVVERQIRRGADLIKVMATGGNLTPGSKPSDSQFDEKRLSGVVSLAGQAGLLTAAHCHGAQGIGEAVRAGINTIEHCSWVGEEGWGKHYNADVVADMAKAGTWVSPTVNKGWNRYLDNPSEHRERVRENFRRMREAGVKFIASTDAGIPGVYHHHLPLALPVFAFFLAATPAAVLRTATSECAEALGLGKVTGQIASGYAADMVIYDKNPLTDLGVLAQPVAVVAKGQLTELG
ncbi:MAG: amidohydrolase family protein [Pseudomonadales bacterium]|nr:amidohydrolase family protein [Pseudomonadales bacterium]